MGRLRFELRTNRLKAECSTAELATRNEVPPMGTRRTYHTGIRAFQGAMEAPGDARPGTGDGEEITWAASDSNRGPIG